MNFRDVFALAFRTVRSNKLRTGLTVSIIAFGIMALIGIITAIKAMNQKFTESFSTMGANAFTIRFKERNIRFGGGNRREVKLTKKGARKERVSNLDKNITKDEAELFVHRFSFPSIKSISIFGNRNNIVSYETHKTSPNVMMFGGDENYLALNGFALQHGRNMNKMDVQTGRNVCVLGYDVAKKLFKQRIAGAVNSVVRINNIPYRVLGVLESRGSTFGFSRDNVIITTYTGAFSAPLVALLPGDRIESLHARRPGAVVKVYADGSACVCWDDGEPQEALGQERMPRELLVKVAGLDGAGQPVAPDVVGDTGAVFNDAPGQVLADAVPADDAYFRRVDAQLTVHFAGRVYNVAPAGVGVGDDVMCTPAPIAPFIWVRKLGAAPHEAMATMVQPVEPDPEPLAPPPLKRQNKR